MPAALGRLKWVDSHASATERIPSEHLGRVSKTRSILSESPNGLRGASGMERAAARRGADMKRCD
ncbi:MAG: hypothetical protein LBC63_05635, partial [Holophagales bacterium]|nr:hypothetical protein [Holophagales bacterium]